MAWESSSHSYQSRGFEEMAEDRRSRRAHPYCRPEPTQRRQTFDLAHKSLRELLKCHTNASFKKSYKKRIIYDHFHKKHPGHRFSNYHFRRSFDRKQVETERCDSGGSSLSNTSKSSPIPSIIKIQDTSVSPPVSDMSLESDGGASSLISSITKIQDNFSVSAVGSHMPPALEDRESGLSHRMHLMEGLKGEPYNESKVDLLIASGGTSTRKSAETDAPGKMSVTKLKEENIFSTHQHLSHCDGLESASGIGRNNPGFETLGGLHVAISEELTVPSGDSIGFLLAHSSALSKNSEFPSSGMKQSTNIWATDALPKCHGLRAEFVQDNCTQQTISSEFFRDSSRRSLATSNQNTSSTVSSASTVESKCCFGSSITSQSGNIVCDETNQYRNMNLLAHPEITHPTTHLTLATSSLANLIGNSDDQKSQLTVMTELMNKLEQLQEQIGRSQQASSLITPDLMEGDRKATSLICTVEDKVVLHVHKKDPRMTYKRQDALIENVDIEGITCAPKIGKMTSSLQNTSDSVSEVFNSTNRQNICHNTKVKRLPHSGVLNDEKEQKVQVLKSKERRPLQPKENIYCTQLVAKEKQSYKVKVPGYTEEDHGVKTTGSQLPHYKKWNHVPDQITMECQALEYTADPSLEKSGYTLTQCSIDSSRDPRKNLELTDKVDRNEEKKMKPKCSACVTLSKVRKIPSSPVHGIN